MGMSCSKRPIKKIGIGSYHNLKVIFKIGGGVFKNEDKLDDLYKELN